MIIIKWLVLISSERVLREFGSCSWKVGWRWSGWTFCALDHDRFFEASLFGHLLAFLVRNHLTFVVKFRFAMSGHFGYVKGMTGTKSSRFTSNIVDVLLDLLLLWPLFHLTMTFFELTAFIFIDHSRRRFVDVLARAFIFGKAVNHGYFARLGEAFSLQFLVTRRMADRSGSSLAAAIVLIFVASGRLDAFFKGQRRWQWTAFDLSFSLTSFVFDDFGLFVAVSLRNIGTDLPRNSSIDYFVHRIANGYFVRVADLFRHVCFHHLVLHLFVINAVFGGNIEAFLTWLRDGDWTALLDHLLFATHGLIGCTFTVHVSFASIHMYQFLHFVAIGFGRSRSDWIDIFAGFMR